MPVTLNNMISTQLGYKMLLQKANSPYYPAQEELKLIDT